MAGFPSTTTGPTGRPWVRSRRCRESTPSRSRSPCRTTRCGTRERSPDVPSKGASAYFPPGAYTYLKSFDVPADWAGKLVSLEFQGAYRHATVFVNEEFAGNRADGYARFVIDTTPYLRFGETNRLRVEVRSGQDSRWYSGAGIHRPVVLHVVDPLHVALDGVRVTTSTSSLARRWWRSRQRSSTPG